MNAAADVSDCVTEHPVHGCDIHALIRPLLYSRSHFIAKILIIYNRMVIIAYCTFIMRFNFSALHA